MKRLIPAVLLILFAVSPAIAQDTSKGAADVLRLLLPFAMQGSPDEQFRLGTMFENGQGVQMDSVQAAHWYRKAADAGHADAQYRLGLLYLSGNGVARDPQAADNWFRAAARQGHAEARQQLSQRGGPPMGGPAMETPPMIREAQTLLSRLGFDPGPADGMAGGKTRDAIRSYQRIKNMTVDGRVDESLLAALRRDSGAPAGRPGMPPGANAGRSVALVAGVGDYEAYGRLRTAEADARAVAQALNQDYDFDSRLLINPTRSAFLDSLRDILRGLDANDRFVLYFAGHGFVDDWTGEGFWLARDSRAESVANWIAHDTVETMLRATKARHVLVIADSHFAGTGHRDQGRDPDTWQRARRMMEKTVREVLVSGAQAPANHGRAPLSPFARRVVDALDRREPVLSAEELLDAVITRDDRRGGASRPALLDLNDAGHQAGGDFVMIRRRH